MLWSSSFQVKQLPEGLFAVKIAISSTGLEAASTIEMAISMSSDPLVLPSKRRNMQHSQGQDSAGEQLDATNGSSNQKDGVKSKKKPKFVLTFILIFVGILALIAVIGLLLTLGGILGFIVSILAAMSGTGLPEQVIVISWSVATLGIIIIASTIIAGIIGAFAGILLTVTRTVLRGR